MPCRSEAGRLLAARVDAIKVYSFCIGLGV